MCGGQTYGTRERKSAEKVAKIARSLVVGLYEVFELDGGDGFGEGWRDGTSRDTTSCESGR